MIEIRNGEGKILHLDPTAKTVAEALENLHEHGINDNVLNESSLELEDDKYWANIGTKGFKSYEDFLDQCVTLSSTQADPRSGRKLEMVSGRLNVWGDVNMSGLGLKVIPVQFGLVTGRFDISNNNLTSLKGSPDEAGYYDCSNNKKLKDLKGGPSRVTYFDCSRNNIRSLKYGPGMVRKDYNCSSCKISDLSGAPTRVDGNFNCSFNALPNLKGSPNIVEGDFDCSENLIVTLAGSPTSIGKSFYCNDNKLTDLSEGPEKVHQDYACMNNKILFTESDVTSNTDVGGTIYV